jgi:transposase
MRNRQFKLSEEARNELRGAYHNCDDPLAKIRFQAVRLYGEGCSTQDIESICGCSRSSLMEWCRAYRRDGVTGLLDHRNGGNHTKLKPHQVAEIQLLLECYTPAQLLGQEQCVGAGEFWTVPDLAHIVRVRTGVVYQSATSYRNLFDKCDFSLQTPGHYYKSRSAQAVMAFEEELEKN